MSVWRPELDCYMFSSILQHFLYRGRVSHLNPQVAKQASLSSQDPVSCLLSTVLPYLPGIYVDAEDVHSVLQTYTENKHFTIFSSPGNLYIGSKCSPSGIHYVVTFGVKILIM